MLIVLMVIICLSTEVYAAEININNCPITSLIVPDEYSVCTADGCDDAFQALLSNNKMTFSDWKAKVMDPEELCVYACDDKNNTECLSVSEAVAESKIDNNSAKNHKYANDYAMIENGDPKDKVLEDVKKSLISGSVSSNGITDIKWINNSSEYPTPFIMYTYSSTESFVTAYQTIYGGYKIILQFTSTTPFTSEKLSYFNEVVSALKFRDTPDYTEFKKLREEDSQKKLEQETNINKNSKTTVYLFAALIFIIVVFAIYMAIRSQKKKKKSR